MKKQLLKTMLLLFALIAGSSSVWAATKTEGFETKATSTTYNSTVTIAANESDCDIAWEIYFGTVSTNDKISGTRSAQMRWYSGDNVGKIPYAKTTTPIDGLTNVTLKARTSNLNVKMDVCYSADGTSWTVGKTHTFTATGTGENVSLDIPSGNKYVKFEVNSSSTAPSSGNYKLIVDDVVFTYTSSTEDATWSLDPASAVVVAGQSTDLQLTTNYDGTLIFVSDDPLIATATYNTSTKVITISAGATTGTTTINVTGAATATYSAINKTIAVTVKHAELESNAIDVMGDLGYSYFGLTPSGSNTYAEAEAVEMTDIYGTKISILKKESSSKPRFDTGYFRFYNGNTLTVTAPAGATLRKIVFIEPSSNKGWSGSMSPGGTLYGEYVSEEKTWYATSEDITSVTLTNDGTKRIASIEIYLKVEPISVTIGTSGYTTLAGFDLDHLKATPTDGLEAYVVTAVSASSVTLEAIPHIPANTGVILKGTPGTTYTIPVYQHGYTVSTNLLKISDGTIKGGDGIYALADKSGTVGFYKVASTVTIPRGKCYLNTNTGAADFLGFEGETTGVNEVKGVKEVNDNSWYNLAGQRVAQPTKGLYIVNGKKVIIK